MSKQTEQTYKRDRLENIEVVKGKRFSIFRRRGKSLPQDPVDRLITKLGNWLVQQPEWLLILGQPRGLRRQLARRLGSAFTTIPTRELGPPMDYLPDDHPVIAGARAFDIKEQS